MTHGIAELIHGLAGFRLDDCRCSICEHADADYRNYRKRLSAMYRDTPTGRESKRRADQNRVVTPEQAERSNAAKRDEHHQLQAETADKARRHGYQWTGPELELASRDDLSTKEVALMIGRTFVSVRNMRRKLQSEPKFQALAGVSREVAS